MKGGGYQVITEKNGQKRFSNGRDGPGIHNESGEADVQIIRSLHPGQSDNDIIQNSIKNQDTYGWLRNISDKSLFASKETPMEKQFRTLNTDQQNKVIEATHQAIDTRLNDSKFPYELMDKDSQEYKGLVASGKNPSRWKIKDGIVSDDKSHGHRLAIDQLHKTLDNFKSIQSEINEEKRIKEFEKRKKEAEERRKAVEAGVQAAKKERDAKNQGLKRFSNQVESKYLEPLSNIVKNQNKLDRLTKKQKLEKASLNLEIHTDKMKAKTFYDVLQSDTRVRDNVTPNVRRVEFQKKVNGLPVPHKELHDEIISNSKEEYNRRLKELERNYNDLVTQRKEYKQERKKDKAENRMLERAAAAAEKQKQVYEEEMKQKEKEMEQKEKEKKVNRKFIQLTDFINEEVILSINNVAKYCTQSELKKIDNLLDKANAIIYKKGPITAQDLDELEKIIFQDLPKVVPTDKDVNDRIQKAFLFQKTLDKGLKYIEDTINPAREKGLFSKKELEQIQSVEEKIANQAEKISSDFSAITGPESIGLMKLVTKDLIQNTNTILESKTSSVDATLATEGEERTKKAGKTRRKKNYKTKTKKHKKKKSKTKRVRKHHKKRRTKRRL
jgi:hypothetical protein